jgi:hypothetical protein
LSYNIKKALGGWGMKKENISFKAEERVAIFKEIDDINFAFSSMKMFIQQEMLTEENKEAIMSTLDFRVATLGKTLNYDTLSGQKIEQKSRDIRDANNKIRELKEQLGSQKPIDGLQEQLRHLSQIMRDWWKELGFQLISNLSFSDYGSVTATFSFYVRGSSKETVLLERGFELCHIDDLDILDNAHNRKILLDLFKERFPSALITDWKSSVIVGGDAQYQLSEMQVILYEIKDLVRGVK